MTIELTPMERAALTVAWAQVQRGEFPMPACATVCVAALARITERGPPAQLPHPGGEGEEKAAPLTASALETIPNACESGVKGSGDEGKDFSHAPQPTLQFSERDLYNTGLGYPNKP